jgi:serine/threonine-protein kinase
MGPGGSDSGAAVSRPPSTSAPFRSTTIGRYVLYEPLSAGGMGSVHFGRLRGSVGFARTVAIKRMHPAFANDSAFVAMFLDEARLAARIHHPNVVATLDVVEHETELFLVMEYIAGVSLSKLMRDAAEAGAHLPPEHAAAIVVGALHGLHAAHEACNEAGEPLAIVHRDISPQNVLVGQDGVPRIIDFGVAKATERIYATRDNGLRGRLKYMAPERLQGSAIDRRADVYSAAVVLWEILTSRRFLEEADNPAALMSMMLTRQPEPPSSWSRDVPRELDEVVLRGLARDPRDRFATALDMAVALETAILPSSQREVAEWVSAVAGGTLRERANVLRHIETTGPGADVALHAAAPPYEVPAADRTFSVVGGHTANAWAEGQPLPSRRLDLRVLAIPAVLGVVLLAWFAGSHHARGRAAQEDERAAAGALAPASLPPVSAGEAAATSSPVVAPEEPIELDPPGSTASAPVVGATPARKVAAPPRPPRSPCNPPYTLDHGIRVPKKECL